MKRIKKYLVSLCLTMVFIFTISTSAFAVDSRENFIDLGDGFYMVEISTPYFLSNSSDLIYGQTTGNVYYGSTLIGTTTLWASFDISGSTAKAMSAIVEGEGYNGGAYIRGVGRVSGNTSYGTAYFNFSGVNKSVSLTISCSPDGSLY